MFALLVDLLHVTQEMPNRGEPQKQTDDYNWRLPAITLEGQDDRHPL